MKIPKRNKLLLLIFAAFALTASGLLVSTGLITAGDPTGVHVTLYKTELLADVSGTPVTVFDNSAGQSVDIVGNPGVFGEGTVLNGTYKRIKFTVKNEVTFSGPNPDTSSCTSEGATVTKSFLIDGTMSATDQVPLYFATADDGGSSGWTANGTSATPFLMQTAIEVSGGDTTVVRLIFNTADTLQCIGGSVELLPPTMGVLSYVIEPPPTVATCEFPAEYWFVHYAIRSQTTDSMGALITDPTTIEMIRNSSAVSGWGTMTFSDVDSSGTGTWSVISNQTYTNDGMAEHRHRLAEYCPDGEATCSDNEEGYFNPTPSDPAAPVMVGTYTHSGGRMILYFPDGGYIEGGMTDDCSTFVGVNVVSADNDLVYAVRKPSGLPGDLPDDSKYMMAMPQFEIKYGETGTVPYKTEYLYFGSDMTVLATTSGATDKMFSWRTSFGLQPDLFGSSGGEWTSQGPREAAELGIGEINDMVDVGSEGLLRIYSMDTPTVISPEFVALGTSGSGIQAGEAQEKDAEWGNHRIYAGLIVNSALTPAISDLAGRWFISTVEARIESGNGVWNDHDERPQFGLSYGEMTIDATGEACGGFAYKDVFTNTLEPPEPGCVQLVLHNECYECITYDSTAGECTGGFRIISTSPCSSSLGITMPVFYVMSPDGSGGTELGAKLALDVTKKVMVIWSPMDAGGVPYSAPTNTNCIQGAADATSCGDASNHSQFGIGVKIQ